MDYNEDRQVISDMSINKNKKISLSSSIVESNQKQHAVIHLDTIGKDFIDTFWLDWAMKQLNGWFFFIEPVLLNGEGEYNLNALIEVKVTESYLGLDVRDCQIEESFYNCTTRQYIGDVMDKCGCLPLNIRLSNKVFHWWNYCS